MFKVASEKRCIPLFWFAFSSPAMHNDFNMFYYVYVLFSLKDRRLYIGQTNELQRRMKEYWRGEVLSTCHRRPLKLIYFEGFLTRQESKRREVWLKSGAGRIELKSILMLTLEKIGYRFK